MISKGFSNFQSSVVREKLVKNFQISLIGFSACNHERRMFFKCALHIWFIARLG